MTRPVYGLTVLRYEDGRTEVRDHAMLARSDYPEEWEAVDAPESWQLRHAMLIDACEAVKREAGVIHTGPDPDEKGFLDKVAAEMRKGEPSSNACGFVTPGADGAPGFFVPSPEFSEAMGLPRDSRWEDLPDLAEFIRRERRARRLLAEGLIDEAAFLKLCPWLAKGESLEKFEGLERNHPTWIIPESAFIDDVEREAGE